MRESRSAEADRPVYVERVNAVIDHIETHLGDELTLDELAAVAHFSPFHFHRIFAVMTGETLGQFIGRLRMERAATRLVQQRSRPVTDIALDCGFSSPSAFSRAFRETFGTTPSAWRRGGHADHERRMLESGPALAAVTAPDDDYRIVEASPAPDTGRTRWRVRAGSLGVVSIEVESVPDLEVAYVRYTGRYAGLAEVFSDLFTRLARWAEPRGFIGLGTPLLSVYHDSPTITAEERLRVSVCVPVPPDTPAEGEIGRMCLPGGRCAVGRFELGVTDYPEAWYALAGAWLPDSGYEPDDRLPFERFVVGREARAANTEAIDIGVPVRPLRRS
jgi:AraC family transcriptional regulator